MGETKPGRHFLTMSRKKLLIIIAVICSVALIAEAALLIRTFSKKKNATGTKKKTHNGTQMVKEGLGHFQTISVPEGSHVVWRVKESYYYWEGQKIRDCSYQYDERGRVIKKIHYSGYGDKKLYTEFTEYDQNGSWFERWYPDKGGELHDLWIKDLTGETIILNPYVYRNETYEIEKDNEGYYTEIRVYRESEQNPAEKQLTKKVTLKYENGRRNITREVYILNSQTGEMEQNSAISYEFNEEGKIEKIVNPNGWNGREHVLSETVYQRDDTGGTCTVTKGNRTDIYVYDKRGNRVMEKYTEEDGSGYLKRHYYPEVNHPEDFDYPGMELSEHFSADGSTEKIGRVEYGQYDQPVRLISLKTGNPGALEYEYDKDGKWKGILYHDEKETYKVMDIELDDYGNLIRFDVAEKFVTYYGIGRRYEWEYYLAPDGK